MKGKPKKETFNLKKHILSFSLMNGTSSSKITIAEQMIPRLLIAFPISRYYVILCQKKDLFRQLSSGQRRCGALPQCQGKGVTRDLRGARGGGGGEGVGEDR